MDDETDFVVIIIGAGFAGAATAFQLLKEGIEGDRILIFDRGEPIGSKNLTGGILWGRELDDFEEFLGNLDNFCWALNLSSKGNFLFIIIFFNFILFL